MLTICGALPDQKIAGPVKRERGLLLNGFDRHETQDWVGNGLARSASASAVSILAPAPHMA
jgi:hypothetical protein